MNINILYDQPVSTLPAGFTTGVSAAVNFFQNQFTDALKLNLHVSYGEMHGNTLGGSLGRSLTFSTLYSYTQIRHALIADAASPDDATAVASLPLTDPTGGGTYFVPDAEAVVLGLRSANTPIDVYVGFSNSASFDYDNSNGVSRRQYDFFGTATHEISEILGRSLSVGEAFSNFEHTYSPLDLFHFSAAGVRDFVGTQAGYFSIDGGVTNLGNFNTDPSGDYGDWASGGADAFLASSGAGVVNGITARDLTVLDILGYNRASATPVAGTKGNDIFSAGLGESLINGNGGHDTVIYSGASDQYGIVRNADGSLTTSDSVGGRDGADQLINIEFLNFTDKTIFAETPDNGNIARLYSAALGRAPDTAGLIFWEDLYANNVPVSAKAAGIQVALAQTTPQGAGASIAQSFIASTEFQSRYGVLDSTGFVTQLYQNVLGRSPDAGGLSYWTDILGHGGAQAVVLVGLAESAENVAKTAGDWLLGV